MTSTVVVGSTGLVGSSILSLLLTLPAISRVHSLTRREPKSTDSKLDAVVEADSSLWASRLSSIVPKPSIFFSALGTTKAAAGGVENQRKIDYDLNLSLAKAAKAAGIEIYILISSAGVSKTAVTAYSRMKAELNEDVQALDFDHTIILQPGLILGTRDHSRPAEAVFRSLANFSGLISGGWLKDPWAQDAEVIGRAAIMAGIQALGGEAPKVWVLGQKDIIRLGRTEWKSKVTTA